MTRKMVYGSALVALAAATAMTLTAIVEPDWLSYSVTTPTGGTASRRLGLHRSCASAADPPCRAFPAAGADCAGTTTTTATATTAGGGGGPFTSCAAWRSTGFLMSFAAAVELAAVVGFLVIVAGGKRRRETGWRILGVLVAVVAALQFAATALVAYVFENDGQFTVPGWRLDSSWYLCTASGVVAAVCGLGLAVSAYTLPPEDGYEFLRDPPARA
ncbi:hypothetical protein P8C59_004562 [Phyllachora maydis]|uniref:Uncharacterized protein n=1 Tax=Phyllachora maydis TaxID=1825666 RepID=A0AAD9I4C2_9PEZI|nr:hypothetical protein P8C59_004562 [Phyllachora maydis]